MTKYQQYELARSLVDKHNSNKNTYEITHTFKPGGIKDIVFKTKNVGTAMSKIQSYRDNWHQDKQQFHSLLVNKEEKDVTKTLRTYNEELEIIRKTFDDRRPKYN